MGNGLSAIWGSGPGDIYAVGGNGTIVHYDGSAWSIMNSGTTHWLLGIWGSGPSDIYAVGSGGTILHYNGLAWSAMDSGTAYELRGVWGSGSSDVYAAGQGLGRFATILHYDGTTWSSMNIDAPEQSAGTTPQLAGIWGSGPGDVYAVGRERTILQYNGTTWLHVFHEAGVDLAGIWGSGPGDIYAVGVATGGSSSAILHYNGTAWSTIWTSNSMLAGIWGSGPSDIYAVGYGGTILHYDGTTWSSMTSGTTNGLQGIWGSGPRDVRVVGGSGTILHIVPPAVTFEGPSRVGEAMALKATLSAACNWPVIIAYASVDDTAVAGTDYVASAGTLTIPPGEMSGTISIPVTLGAGAVGKTFHVNLSCADATLVTSRIDVTISETGIDLGKGVCGRGVGASNLIMFYAFCWMGLVCMRRTHRPKTLGAGLNSDQRPPTRSFFFTLNSRGLAKASSPGGEAGDTGTRRRGDAETRRRGDAVTGREGDVVWQ